MKTRRVLMVFDSSLPQWPDENGVDQILSAGRMGVAPYPNVNTNIVQFTAPDTVSDDFIAAGDYPWFEDVIEEVLPNG